MEKRAPIVTVLGHVDHGKTSLLDKIRNSNITRGEAGGITQSIGASMITTKEGSITFIDTPGHAAFNKMRETGAKIADIAILVVAADDGPMPQTKEALEYIKKTNLPMLVAISKIDLKTANIERALGEMEKLEVFFEGRGGNTPFVKLSSETGEGINELLEMLELMGEVGDIVGDKEAKLESYVFETKMDKGGPLVSIAIKNGSVRIGDAITDGVHAAKVKNLWGADGKPTKSANPGEAVQVLGFRELPQIGNKITEGEITEKKDQRKKTIPSAKDDQIALIIKADSAGALEALANSLPPKAIIMDKSVGDVTDADVFFAKTTNSKIYTFGASIPSSVKKLAETEDVEVQKFRIIYELIQKVEKLIEEKQVVINGVADILATFPFNKLTVAGCKIRSGKITKKDSLELKRGEKVLGQVKIKSLKKGKTEVDEVATGEECGIIFVPQLEFEAGDVLVSSQN